MRSSLVKIHLFLCLGGGGLGRELTAQALEHGGEDHHVALAAGVHYPGLFQHGIHLHRLGKGLFGGLQSPGQELLHIRRTALDQGGGGLGGWLETMEGKDFNMTGMPFAKISKDKPVTFYKVETEYPGYGSVAITTSCKNPELAVRWLDYGYGEEGNILYNFGTEGVSFEKKDGKYVYTDLIFKNPDGLTMQQAMANYFRSSAKGPFVQDKDYIDQFYFRPQQQEALNAWLSNFDAVSKNNIPKISKNADESGEYTDIMTEISRYESKMFTGFIMGTNSLSEYDAFINKLKDLKIDRAIEIQSAALDRYNSREHSGR